MAAPHVLTPKGTTSDSLEKAKFTSPPSAGSSASGEAGPFPNHVSSPDHRKASKSAHLHLILKVPHPLQFSLKDPGLALNRAPSNDEVVGASTLHASLSPHTTSTQRDMSTSRTQATLQTLSTPHTPISKKRKTGNSTSVNVDNEADSSPVMGSDFSHDLTVGIENTPLSPRFSLPTLPLIEQPHLEFASAPSHDSIQDAGPSTAIQDEDQVRDSIEVTNGSSRAGLITTAVATAEDFATSLTADITTKFTQEAPEKVGTKRKRVHGSLNIAMNQSLLQPQSSRRNTKRPDYTAGQGKRGPPKIKNVAKSMSPEAAPDKPGCATGRAGGNSRKPRVVSDLTISMNSSALQPRDSRRVTVPPGKHQPWPSEKVVVPSRGLVILKVRFIEPETTSKLAQPAKTPKDATPDAQPLTEEVANSIETEPMALDVVDNATATNPAAAATDVAMVAPNKLTEVATTSVLAQALTSTGLDIKGNRAGGGKDRNAKAPLDFTAPRNPNHRVQKRPRKDTPQTRTPSTSPLSDPAITPEMSLNAIPSPPPSVEAHNTDPITDNNEKQVPNADNNFEFTSGNASTGRSAEDLDKLFALPKREPAGNKPAKGLSYTRLGQLAAPGFAQRAVEKMEKAEKKYQKDMAKQRGEEWSDDD